MGRLSGKIAIVTGGARGMGEATCRLFAEEGAKVVIADVLEAEGQALAADLGEAALFVKLDVSNEANWQAVDKTIRETFGPANVLVNNAGILRMGQIVDFDHAGFDPMMRINVGGVLLGMKTIAPGMIAAGGGSIINISSAAGLEGQNYYGVYAATKWGVRGITKVAAMEMSPHGVRVNSVHPGAVRTHMSNPNNISEEELEQRLEGVKAFIPLRRMAKPIEIARVSLFLASDDASYVSGAEIAVDGGLTAGVNLAE